jgi:ABC-type amino acid transport substrate-binding protein
MLGKRVLTFSVSPSWVNLTGQDTFIEMVQTVSRAEWGMNTNFAAALKMILDAIVQNKLAPDDVEDMVLAIFSDMQMDEADRNQPSLIANIEAQYADAGMRLWGKPFKTPHILFWNLRSTDGFPTLSSQKNASMMSGFSPALLNLFCEEGLNALQTCTPWSLFIKSLSNDRYNPLDKIIRETL